MSNSFDDLLEIEGLEENKNSNPIAPLFTVPKGDSDKLKKWITNAFEVLMKRNQPFFEEIKENLKLYRGNVFDSGKSQANSRLTNDNDVQLEKQRNAKLYVNKIYDLVEFRVATHNAAKPGIDIGPAGTDYEDRIGAQIARSVVDSIWYQNDQDELERNALRYCFIAGEHYVLPFWDANKGDLHPDYQAESEMGEEVEELEEGAEKLKEKKKDPLSPVRIGELGFKHYPAWQVLPEPQDDFKKVTWTMCWDYEYVDVLKKEFPKKKALLKHMNDASKVEGFDAEFLRRLRAEGKIIVLTIISKRCTYLPNGRYIRATMDGEILVDKDLPYEHDDNPLVRLTDLDIPGELRGKSFIRNIKGLQWQNYFLTSMMAANARLMCYPKWLYEQGSIQIKDFVNARTMVGVRPGATFPTLLQPNPTPPEVINQIEYTDIQMDTKVKGAFSNPAAIPKRVDSQAAFQYLDEKDSSRSHTMFAKVNKFRVTLTQLVLSIAGQFYRPEDGRLLRIVGKNQQHEISKFTFSNFNRPYDIRVNSGSALPDEKGARMRTIVELVEKLPEGTFSPQQILDLIDLGSVDKLYNLGTKSLRAAESIIQDLLMGNPVPEPEGYEDLIVYWQTFSTYIQDRTFKEAVKPENKQMVLDYLIAIEALMYDKAQKNPLFAQQVQSLPLYPLVFALPPVLPEPMPPEAAAAPMSPEEEQMLMAEQAPMEPSPEEMDAMLAQEQDMALMDLAEAEGAAQD